MNLKFIIILFLIIAIQIDAATYHNKMEKNNIDDELMIAVPNSELYVRVRGNPEKPLIIDLHGGPGGYSGIDIKLMGLKLEDNFLLAYLDQRGCGKSLECNDTALLTVEQYVADLDIVIDSLVHKYRKEKVNLMGTSWGGMYGFLYLLSYSNKVNAYACIDGKVNSKYQNSSIIKLELSKAKALLKTAAPPNKKKELNFIINKLNRIKNSNFGKFYKDVNWIKHDVPGILGFNAYFTDTSKIISTNDVLQDSSLLNLMKYTKEEYLKIGEKAEIVNRAFRNNKTYNNLNLEPLLSQVSIPVSVIQGEMDYVVGVRHAEIIYSALTGLSEDKKEIHIIPNAGHCPAIESPETLSKILNEFFKKFN